MSEGVGLRLIFDLEAEAISAELEAWVGRFRMAMALGM